MLPNEVLQLLDFHDFQVNEIPQGQLLIQGSFQKFSAVKAELQQVLPQDTNTLRHSSPSPASLNNHSSGVISKSSILCNPFPSPQATGYVGANLTHTRNPSPKPVEPISQTPSCSEFFFITDADVEDLLRLVGPSKDSYEMKQMLLGKPIDLLPAGLTSRVDMPVKATLDPQHTQPIPTQAISKDSNGSAMYAGSRSPISVTGEQFGRILQSSSPTNSSSRDSEGTENRKGCNETESTENRKEYNETEGTENRKECNATKGTENRKGCNETISIDETVRLVGPCRDSYEMKQRLLSSKRQEKQLDVPPVPKRGCPHLMGL
ncbi:unnamed protein product [Coregonus sp. 'balchen']|nr:unnamed protein product [Coregonus sp. 'balchen']